MIDFPITKITKAAVMLAAGAALCTAPLMAQAGAAQDEEDAPGVSLVAPDGQNLYGSSVANVRKATAIVNGEVITGTDIDERLALLTGGQQDENLSSDQRELVRQQVLANLIDETLKIQEAEAKEIEISEADIDQMYAEVARTNGLASPEALSRQLNESGSSPRSMRRQLRGEIAWQRLMRREISPFVNVGDEEVHSVLDRMIQSKGTTEVRLGEIYLTATPENAQEVADTARKIIASIQQGGSFTSYASQFSQASTASRGGDLGWVRPEMLPESFVQALSEMEVGQIAGPIPAPGGISILYLMDKRQVLGTNTQDTILSLKQVYIDFEPGAAQSAVKQTIDRFAAGVGQINGCGDAENVAKQIGAQVISRDDIRLGDLPGPLRSVMSELAIGQATPPYGSPDEGVRAFVLCGRDAPAQAGLPSVEQIRDNLEQDRINKKARIYLRDLRQDAIIRYN